MTAGQVAIVTGGTYGIGKAITLTLAAKGYRVVAFGLEAKQIGSAVHSVGTANTLAPLSILFPTGPGTKVLRRNLLVLAFIDMVILGAAMSAGTVIVLYTKYIYGWGNFESSAFISMVSMVRVVILTIIFPAINYIFRTRPAAGIMFSMETSASRAEAANSTHWMEPGRTITVRMRGTVRRSAARSTRVMAPAE